MKALLLPFSCVVCGTALAAPVEQIDVLGRKANLVGSASSASEGRIAQAELQLRPLLRTGDVLESVPGLVATQHSGSGKANSRTHGASRQARFFLRGFNLDHGTDFATFVEGMPVNMRTHGHGQGYTDLNFLIPELIGEISFRKGSYYKEAGDFSATGTAAIRSADHLEHDSLSLSTGDYGFRRALLSGSAAFSVIYTFGDAVELYASVGQGFHSNDARGTTITLDPVTANPVDRVDPLVGTLGSEIGARVFLTDRWNASAALWQLGIDSELLFVGDAGNTEDTGAGSQRHGLELTLYHQFTEQLSLDLEYARTDSRFDVPQDGSRDIPGALEHVLSGGVSLRIDDSWLANLRLRNFSDYPLDGGLRADASTLLNLRLGWQPLQHLSFMLDVLNLLDGRDRDIQYAYASQLPGESEPVEDRHFHVFEPRALRLYATYHF